MPLNALINPLKLSIAIGCIGALIACSGNSSSSSFGPSAIIDPIEVDDTIEAVEWTAENYVINASHAYRVVSQNTMMRLVLTNQLAAFDALVNLLRVDSSRNCANSGRMTAEKEIEQCFEDTPDRFEGNPVSCNQNSVLRRSAQISRAFACQDGAVVGKYLDGFFSTIQTTDLTDDSERKTSTTISALGMTETFNSNGERIDDEFGNPVLKQLKSYLFQSDTARFFFDHEYESYVDFSQTKLMCGDNEYITVERQGVRSSEVGTLEGDGDSDFYLYTKLTDLDLQAIPAETCGEGDKQDIAYSYNFTATMANAAMGGGENRNTSVSWPNMAISLKGEPSGIMTLVHKNSDVENVTVVVEFQSDGFVSIKRDAEVDEVLPLADFFALSKPPVEE